jgi:hypothetical protein
MIQRFLIAACSTIAIAGSSDAFACTQQEAITKGVAVKQMIESLKAENSDHARQAVARMQLTMQSRQDEVAGAGSTGWDKACDVYDEMIREAQ